MIAATVHAETSEYDEQHPIYGCVADSDSLGVSFTGFFPAWLPGKWTGGVTLAAYEEDSDIDVFDARVVSIALIVLSSCILRSPESRMEETMARRAGMLVGVIFLTLSCAIPVHQTTGQWVPGMTPVATPKVVLLDVADGQERGQEATMGSGQAMVGALRDRLMGHNMAVQTIQSVEIEKGYEEATRLGFDYVLRGVFTNWEDNATAWSANPDRAEFAIELYSVPDKRLAGSASHRVQASGFTLLSSTPMRFIPELADNTLGRLFGWPTVK